MKRKNWENILTDKAELSQMNRAKNGEMVWVIPILYVAVYMMMDTMTTNMDITAILNSLLTGGFLMAGSCMMLAGWLYDHCGNTIFHCIVDERGDGLEKLIKKRKMYALVMAGVPAVVFIAGVAFQMSGQTDLYNTLIKPRTVLIYIVPAIWGFYSFTLRKKFTAINKKING